MAEGKIKRGFATYLFILLMVFVAAFLIIIVVMIFSPFKNVLGFKYLSYNMSNNIVQTSSEQDIDFSTIDELYVNCNNANVVIQRDNNIDTDTIRIENTCKGFARSSDNTSFDYNIALSGASNDILNIDVHEPEGFLFFDKTVTISILIPAKSSYNFENTDVNISNTSGSIMIGNRNLLSENNPEVKTSLDINTLSIKTNKGRIYFYKYLDGTFNNLFIKTSSSEVTSYVSDLSFTNKLSLYTDKGSFDFSSLKYTGAFTNNYNAEITLNNGDLAVQTLDGNVNLKMVSGYFDVANLNGSLSSNDMVEQMQRATISIGKIDGNVSLPFANDSRINIGELTSGSQIYVKGTSGSININGLNGKGFLEMTSGDINVTTYSDDLKVKTTSGDINISYQSPAIVNETIFETNSGEINLQILGNLSFILRIYDTSGNYRDGRNIWFEYFGNSFSNPLIVNSGSKYLTIKSNSDISISLIK